MLTLKLHLQGFYPGYYHFFVMSSFVTSIARDVRTTVRPLFVAPGPLASLKFLYDLITCFSTNFIMSYGGMSFAVWNDSYSCC